MHSEKFRWKPRGPWSGIYTARRAPLGVRRGPNRMGYIIALVLLLVVVPVLFVLLSRGSRGAGTLGGGERKAGGLSASRPSSDEPTPGAGTVNETSPEATRRVPPG